MHCKPRSNTKCIYIFICVCIYKYVLSLTPLSHRDTRGIYVAGADDLAWILQRTATHVAVRCNNSLQHGIHVTETDDLTRMLNGSATHAAAHCNSPQQCRIHVVAGWWSCLCQRCVFCSKWVADMMQCGVFLTHLSDKVKEQCFLQMWVATCCRHV